MTRPLAVCLAANILCLSMAVAEDKPKSAEDPIAMELDKAKESYQAAVKSAGEKLVAAFEAADMKAQKSKLSNEQYVKLSDKLMEERKTFEADPSKLPKSSEMSAAVKEFNEASADAKSKCKKAFEKAETAYRAKNPAAMKKVMAEKDKFFTGGTATSSVQQSPAIDWKSVEKGVGKITMAVLQNDTTGAVETGTQKLTPDEFDKKVNSGIVAGLPGSAYAVNKPEANTATNAALAAWRDLRTGLSDKKQTDKDRMSLLDNAIKKAEEAENALGNPVVKKAFSDWSKLLSGFKKGTDTGKKALTTDKK